MKANNVFSVLYRTRVKVQKDDTPILNLSLIFSVVAVCSCAVAGRDRSGGGAGAGLPLLHRAQRAPSFPAAFRMW